ncbi:recombinase family protein [Rathayibacter oskolensis]|uniref:recombinase family protein n=1 Tax=Rathayibacter oskolensis TaxID=1891671 RepID=UPI00265F6DA7|nr:recombinase family protein [Rathayibacter oskolensis]WKK71428.1 recombinase family protein [Rathayibacter oskolensis]
MFSNTHMKDLINTTIDQPNRPAAIYVRISKDRVGAGLGVERQESDCRKLAEREGYEVVTVFSDNDVSAYSGKRRPGYEGLLAAMKSGAIQAVFAWHTDRVHRRPTELEPYIEASDQFNIPTFTVQAGPFASTPPAVAWARASTVPSRATKLRSASNDRRRRSSRLRRTASGAEGSDRSAG